MINKIATSYTIHSSQIKEEKYEDKIEGRILFLFKNGEDLESSLFWERVKNHLLNLDWDELYLAPGETISREQLALYAQLEMEIPPIDLIHLKGEISEVSLTELVSAKLPPLHIATYLGSIPLLEKALLKGGDLEEIYENEDHSFHKYAPLSMAFRLAKLDVFKWLLEKGATFKPMDQWKDPLKSVYKKNEWQSFVQLMIRYQFIEYRASQLFNSPLHDSAIEGDKEYLEYLFSLNIPMNLQDYWKRTPLYYAIENNHYELVDYLLSLDVPINERMVECALRNENREILELLLKKGAPFSQKHLVDYRYQPQKLKLLLAHLDNMTPWSKCSLLTLVRISDQPPLFKLFLDHCEVDKESLFSKIGEGCPWDRAQKKEIVVLKALFAREDFDINIESKKGPLLHALIRYGNYDLLEIALSHPHLNKNCVDTRGVTPLQLAVARNDIRIVKMLLERGTDPNAPCFEKISPLHIAAYRGNEEMVKLLLDFKANKEAKEDDGWIPLLYAVHCTESLVNLLRTKDPKIPSSMIFWGHKMKHLPFAKSLYKSLESGIKWRYKEEWMRKLCAHAFELKGNSPLISFQKQEKEVFIRLEGMVTSEWLFGKLNETLKKLTTFPKKTGEMLSEVCTFSRSSASKTDEEFLERFHEGKPCILLTGYIAHAVTFVFQKIDEENAIFGVCNRHHPIQLFRMNPAVLTKERVAKFRAYTALPVKSYEKMLQELKELSQTDLGLEHILKYYPLEVQKVGNCSWASFEAAIWTLIAIHAVREKEDLTLATELFNSLQIELKIHFATKYFDSHINGMNPYFPDMTLCQLMIKQVGSYSTHLQSQYKELSIQFKALPYPELKKEESEGESAWDLFEKYYFV